MGMYEFRIDGRSFTLSEDEFEALWPLLSPYCNRRDPLKGQWHTEHPDVARYRRRLFGLGLIDCYGNIGALGKAVVEAVLAEHDEWAELQVVEHELEELDRLDAACRKRPHTSRYDG